MLTRRSEQLRAAVRAFEVQLDVVLPGDRNASVHLDGLAANRANAAEVADGSAIASLTTARADCTAT